jgi:hypothetical protein
MRRKKEIPSDQVEELTAKLVAINLWTAGASQGTIARALGKSKTWVNEFLKDVPKPN